MAQELTGLVVQAQKGCENALNDLIAQCYEDLYYFAYKTVKNEDLAADITHDSCIIIIQKLNTLKDPGAFKSWARQIVYHQCTHHFRDSREVQVVENEDNETIFDTLADTDTSVMPEEVAQDKAFQKIMQDLLNELPAEQRAALMLYYYEKMSVGEIASIQRVSEGTIKSRLNYGRKAVKTKVEEYEKKNGIRLHSTAFLPLLLYFLFRTGAKETGKSGVALAPGAAAGIVGAAGVGTATIGIGVKIAVAAGLIAAFGVIGSVIGSSIISPGPSPTNPTIMATPTSSSTTVSTTVPTTAPTTQNTTVPTTVPTTAPTTRPVYKHPNDSATSDSDILYQPEDIPKEYWAVLNNQQPIYFPEGCTDGCCNPCYAWLDDYRFAYDFIELAACDFAEYFLMDMDSDGSEELLIRASDTLLLREKDGIVYGYSFIFRQMMEVYTDGTFSYNYGGNGIETGIKRISFKEDGNYEITYLCECWIYSPDGEEDYFRINGIDVTEDEYLEYEETLTFEKVAWKKLGRYPIREATIPGG